MSKKSTSKSFAERIKVQIAEGSENAPDDIKIYIWSGSQYILYPIIAVISWLNISLGWNLLWSIPLAFSIYNIWMTGHDACHNSVFRAHGTKLNKALAFICLDCTIMTQKSWLIVHHKEHHAFPNSSVDGQRLTGEGKASELWNVFLLVLEYLRMDLMDCVKEPTIQKVITLLLRYALLVSIGWGLPLTIFWLVFFAANFGLLSHSAPPLPNAVTFREKQLSNAIDMMPGNWLMEFLTGGLNTHAVHHVWPHLPRGLHGWASNRLEELEPKFYRKYGFKETVSFFWNHQNPKVKNELPNPKEYYKK